MARILITGSADGFGLLTGRRLIEHGHAVVLHARDEAHAEQVGASMPGAAGVIVGDLSTLAGIHSVACRANNDDAFDVVIHDAGVGYQDPNRVDTVDGLDQLFTVNVLAPYLLTALMDPPKRLIYLTSGLHRNGVAALDDLQWEQRQWDGMQAFADSKLFVTVLAAHIARQWPFTRSNAVEAGIETYVTQAWLAVSDDPAALRSGGYFLRQEPREPHPAVADASFGQRLVNYCAELGGVHLPDIG